MINKKQKQLLLEQLHKTPIIQIACEKVGVSRATYYRWRKEDAEFTKESDKAIIDGSLFINDMAESQLISAIRDKNLTAIIFWLKNHHKIYTTKVELSGRVEIDNEPLTPEQEALIKKALQLAGLNPNEKIYEQSKPQ
jgi:predicted DNA binding protein